MDTQWDVIKNFFKSIESRFCRRIKLMTKMMTYSIDNNHIQTLFGNSKTKEYLKFRWMKTNSTTSNISISNRLFDLSNYYQSAFHWTNANAYKSIENDKTDSTVNDDTVFVLHPHAICWELLVKLIHIYRMKIWNNSMCRQFEYILQ